MKSNRLIKTKCEKCGFENFEVTGNSTNIGWQCPNCSYWNILIEKYYAK